ncbi:hypothetical protein GYMLUDRAFT_195458 [Collybiopsis luxurians FD-317 M1]|nr:hypothetical protein GYMLUDRAFT_195458 [Collybiopsis luxurians FD-317 M1]
MAELNIRTFPATFPTTTGSRSKPVMVALADLYTHWALVLPHEPNPDAENVLESTPIVTLLSTLPHPDPFPRAHPSNGNSRFYMKTYTENEGILPQLISLGIVRPVDSPQSTEAYPMVEVMLQEREISHSCLSCIQQLGAASATFEFPGQAQRMMRCSGCKTVFYCSTDCQRRDWKEGHKHLCRIWAVDPSEAKRLVENARRQGITEYMKAAGAITVNLGS